MYPLIYRLYDTPSICSIQLHEWLTSLDFKYLISDASTRCCDLLIIFQRQFMLCIEKRVCWDLKMVSISAQAPGVYVFYDFNTLLRFYKPPPRSKDELIVDLVSASLGV